MTYLLGKGVISIIYTVHKVVWRDTPDNILYSHNFTEETEPFTNRLNSLSKNALYKVLLKAHTATDL